MREAATPEAASESVAAEDAAIIERAERDAADFGTEGATAAEDFRTGVETEERQTMERITAAQEAMTGKREGGDDLTGARDEAEMPVEMSADEQAEREAEAAALVPETGPSDEQAAPVLEAGPEIAESTAERLREEVIEALRTAEALEAELMNEGIDIERLDGILSDAETARENLDGYDDPTLERYRQLLSDRIEALSAVALSLESSAHESREAMKNLEEADRTETGPDANEMTGGLAEFSGLVTEIKMAEKHMTELESDIAAETDPEKKAALASELDDLGEHVAGLQERRTRLLAPKGDAQESFMTRLMKYQDAKEGLEKTLSDIERVVAVGYGIREQTELLDEIILERDRSVEIDVAESGTERDKGTTGEEEALETSPRSATRPAAKKKPAAGAGAASGLSGIGAGGSTAGKESKKKETLGETAKRYAKETWKDIKDIFGGAIKGFGL